MNTATLAGALGLAFGVSTSALLGGPPRVEVVRCSGIPNLRSGIVSVRCTLRLGDGEAKEVFGGRAFIDVAIDDRGNSLKQEGAPEFRYDRVGRVSGDSSETTASQPIEVRLAPLRPGTERLRQLIGRVEFFIPALDPDSTIVLDAPALPGGVAIESAALRAVGVGLVVYDKAGITANDHAALPNGAELPMQLRERVIRDIRRMVDDLPVTEVIVAAVDPGKRLYSVEFQHKDGSPLRYNHNGNFHLGSAGAPTPVYHGFDLGQPMSRDVRLVIRVITPRSIRVVPFAISDIPVQGGLQKR